MATKKPRKKKTQNKPLRVPVEKATTSAPKAAEPKDGPPTRPTKKPPEKKRQPRESGEATGSHDAARPFRDVITEAVFQESIAGDLGLSKRQALWLSEGVADRLRCPDNLGAPPESGFYDLRADQDFDYPNADKPKARLVAPGVPALRKIEDVDTIVIHQTAVEFGVSDRQVKAAGGDVELARAKRALDVACHCMAFRQGYFVAVHDLEVYVNHAGRFNAGSLGLEIDGRYPGLEDDPDTAPREDLKTTWGGTPTKLSAETVRASIAAIGWMVEETARKGGKIRRLVSHRQSSDTRRSDPGEAIWQRVVLPAADKFGLEIDVRSPWRTGRPVPVEWDPENGIGKY